MGSAVKSIGRAAKSVVSSPLSLLGGGGASIAAAQGAGGGQGAGGVTRVSQSFASENLAKDIAKGQEVLGKDFQEGSLGRIDANRSADMNQVVEARKAGLGGLSAEENQALRERASQGIDRGTQTAVRNLRGIQAASGVRGASAASQVGRQLSAGQSAKAAAERDLLIANVDRKQQAVGALEQSVTGAEATEQDRSIFNLKQQQAEKFARQSAGLGFAQLGVTERTGAQAANVAAASAAQGSGGKK